ncbi:U3 small nucleolar RNA-associated protein [Pisolithus orientalis]|uniref:U3 small nucleolar RNA-associated protein n=1 Tax=Pisolithus orientalis TaxID=936130 RepID=UPI00222515CE|nr:U3 small nucleolar RNA-associated protein [Pisolithus orientalis]KAI6012396.1 U3 small nucleolar RNA-associated protein [Pisolithus orientalis]
MVGNQRLKYRGYKKLRTIEPLYTGGPVAITSNGSNIVTCLSGEALFTDVKRGRLLCRFPSDGQSITSLCLTPDASHLVTFTDAPSLRLFKIPKTLTGQPAPPSRITARPHDAPVHVCAVDPTSTYLASGSADGVVKVWEISTGHVTHVFKGHGGVVSALKFNFPRNESLGQHERVAQLITASVDTKIRVFDLTATSRNDQGALRPVAVLEGHVSVPRGLDVTPDGKWLLSGGRDAVVLIWDMTFSGATLGQNKGKSKALVTSPTPVKTIPVMERVEAVGFVHCDCDGSSTAADQHLFTAGEKGVVKIWNWKGTLLHHLGTGWEQEQEEQRQVLEAMYIPTLEAVLSVHADQNIFIHSVNSGKLTQQLIGFNDEIVDAAFLSPAVYPSNASESSVHDNYIALATNSSLIRVYSTSGSSVQLLPGHSDIVLSLDRSAGGHVFASGSKDNSARIWAPSHSSAVSAQWTCVAFCEGHAGSVGAVAISRTHSDTDTRLRFLFTGSQDRTIKMWDLSDVPLTSDDQQVLKCRSLTTFKAHEKDINSLDVAPTDQLLASGSQDRTANVYEIFYCPSSGSRPPSGEIKILGTCKGHKRGVWNVKFGKTERVLATGSGDKTIRLWNLEDFTCVKTFEGHANSVLRVDFINHGTQLVSSASDGLVKLWSTREEECTATLDNHEDKVWALAISTDERVIVSAAADSVVTFWEDCTEEYEQEKEAKRVEQVLKEQDFVNYIALHDYRRAIELALSMQQPGKLFLLFGDIKSSATESLSVSNGSVTGHLAVDEVLRSLSGQDLALLLRYVRDWNSNAKTSGVAQSVLYAMVKLRPIEDIVSAFGNESSDALSSEANPRKQAGGRTAFKELIDSLIPYTQRHLSRLGRLVQESFVLDYILSEMDGEIFEGEGHVVAGE